MLIWYFQYPLHTTDYDLGHKKERDNTHLIITSKHKRNIGLTIHLDKILKDYCDYAANPSEHIIQHSVSTLYKHQQNLSE